MTWPKRPTPSWARSRPTWPPDPSGGAAAGAGRDRGDDRWRALGWPDEAAARRRGPGLQHAGRRRHHRHRESQLGERYILYFYPKDDTPGCTPRPARCATTSARVMDTGVEVFGVSPGLRQQPREVPREVRPALPPAVRSRARGGRCLRRLGREEVRRARPTRASSGSSFIIGPDGKIEHVLERVKPMEHVDLLLGALAA